jgi:hypothetical protein
MTERIVVDLDGEGPVGGADHGGAEGDLAEGHLELVVVAARDQLTLEADDRRARGLVAELGVLGRAVLKARRELERGLTVPELQTPANGRAVLRARAGIETAVEPEVVLEAQLERGQVAAGDVVHAVDRHLSASAGQQVLGGAGGERDPARLDQLARPGCEPMVMVKSSTTQPTAMRSSTALAPGGWPR